MVRLSVDPELRRTIRKARKMIQASSISTPRRSTATSHSSTETLPNRILHVGY